MENSQELVAHYVVTEDYVITDDKAGGKLQENKEWLCCTGLITCPYNDLSE